jgi:hypothetical protein
MKQHLLLWPTKPISFLLFTATTLTDAAAKTQELSLKINLGQWLRISLVAVVCMLVPLCILSSHAADEWIIEKPWR